MEEATAARARPASFPAPVREPAAALPAHLGLNWPPAVERSCPLHLYNCAVKVAIDARKLHDFGIGTYIRNLLRHLARIDTRTEYVLLCQEPDLDVGGAARPELPHRPRAVAELFAPRADARAVGAAAASGPTCSTRRTTCCRPPSAADRW